MHAGHSEDEAKYYDERFQKGGYLVTVHTDEGRYNDARTVLQRHGADMHGAGTASSQIAP